MMSGNGRITRHQQRQRENVQNATAGLMASLSTMNTERLAVMTSEIDGSAQATVTTIIDAQNSDRHTLIAPAPAITENDTTTVDMEIRETPQRQGARSRRETYAMQLEQTEVKNLLVLKEWVYV